MAVGYMGDFPTVYFVSVASQRCSALSAISSYSFATLSIDSRASPAIIRLATARASLARPRQCSGSFRRFDVGDLSIGASSITDAYISSPSDPAYGFPLGKPTYCGTSMPLTPLP
jgi:hypothetical protein